MAIAAVCYLVFYFFVYGISYERNLLLVFIVCALVFCLSRFSGRWVSKGVKLLCVIWKFVIFGT